MQAPTSTASHTSVRNATVNSSKENARNLGQILPKISNPPSSRSREARGVENFWASSGAAAPLSSLVHDVRNMVAALRLYCELLKEPGVLSEGNGHYASDLQMVADAAARLIEQMTWIAGQPSSRLAGGSAVSVELTASAESGTMEPAAGEPIEAEYLPMTSAVPALQQHASTVPMLPSPVIIERSWTAPNTGGRGLIEDLGSAVRSMRPLLAAMAGAAIELEVECLPCEGSLRLSPEDLTRILVNLVCNASEAMPHGGTIRITTQRGAVASFLPARVSAKFPQTILLAVQDAGIGVAAAIRDHVFDAGFSTRMGFKAWPANAHRGLGLSIARELVELAGGSMRLVSEPARGARFEMEFPLQLDSSDYVAAVTDATKGRQILC